MEARYSIPSRYETERPKVFMNEGGERCFGYDSLWFKLKHGQVTNMKDALWLGGTDPKYIVDVKDADGSNMKTIWKPQLPVGKGFHAMAQNEIIVFHVDCILNLRRTPPASLFFLETEEFQKEMTPSTDTLLTARGADWNTWNSKGLIHGVAQVMWGKVRNINVFGQSILKFGRTISNYLGIPKEYFLYILGANTVSIRELSTRDLLDYVTGNWDRHHNEFVIPSKKGGTELIYLDHNHLKRNRKAPFKLQYCKFWKNDIKTLKKIQRDGLQDLLLKSLRKYEPGFRMFEKQDRVFRHLDIRVDEFLEHVKQCESKYGLKYVYDE